MYTLPDLVAPCTSKHQADNLVVYIIPACLLDYIMSWGLFVWYLGVIVIVADAQGDGGESKLVHIVQGPVRGYRDPQSGVFAFYNIPYATAKDRYKAPVAPPTWSEPFEAIDRGITCPQGQTRSIFNGMLKRLEQEDCLIANVFVPDTEETNLPVVVHVHGGAFQVGNYNSEQLTTFTMSKKIITVTFNYRIGILGFLCLGTEKIPGNAGMKDQVAVLRWVKQNIASFGGNPDDVTLSGCSAGSGSVNVLTVSKTTKGLFKRVISDSGASTGSFAVQTDPLANAKNSAKLLNFADVDNIKALEEFYLTASTTLLNSRSFMNNENSEVTFGPCVERDTSEEKFLEDAPYNILKRGDYERIPIMYGLTDLEGLVRNRQFPEWKDRMNEDFSDFLPADLQFDNEEQKAAVAQTVKEFYFGTEPITDESIISYIDYFTDVVYVYSVLLSVNLHLGAGNSPIYLFEYSFYDNNTSAVSGTDVRGANHCAQSRAVQDEDETRISEEYRQMKSIMRDLWDNFIRTGQPVPEVSSLPAWPPVGANRSPHLSLGRKIELKGPLLEQRARFWDNIYERHYRPPVPPNPASL